MDEPSRGPTHRSSRFELAGRRRSEGLALRLGTALRDARQRAGLTQSQAAERSGLSQAHISYLERGLGNGASIQTWSIATGAVGEQLVAFVEHAPGADRPRDFQHLRRQNALIAFATPGGWHALPEFAVDLGSTRSRSIDVALIREMTREAIVVEIWDWFDDVGAGLRSLDAKVAALASLLATRSDVAGAPWRVAAIYVVRDTRRNRLLLAEFRDLFAARFRGSSYAWLRALRDPRQAVPAHDGLLWSDRTGTRLKPSRL